jgi:hypothetical protein
LWGCLLVVKLLAWGESETFFFFHV